MATSPAIVSGLAQPQSLPAMVFPTTSFRLSGVGQATLINSTSGRPLSPWPACPVLYLNIGPSFSKVMPYAGPGLERSLRLFWLTHYLFYTAQGSPFSLTFLVCSIAGLGTLVLVVIGVGGPLSTLSHGPLLVFKHLQRGLGGGCLQGYDDTSFPVPEPLPGSTSPF